MINHQELWTQVKNSLKSKNSTNKMFQSWFEPTSLISVQPDDSRGCRFRLGVPTDLHKYWISQNLLSLISSEISALYQSPFQIELIVTGEDDVIENDEGQQSFNPGLLTNPYVAEDDDSAPAPGSQSTVVVTSSPPTHTAQATMAQHRRDLLNYDYTFSTFVVGRNNEFAHAASYAIAENPGMENYNPLFICGPTGMGKTHLLNSVGNHIRLSHPDLKICYVSAERFLNECISSIRRNEMPKFRTRYRDNCEVMLMDDIQVLGRGEAVQEEFFHTLNDFFDKGQQVVVASDRMPKDINGLEDRIRTRLEWGLIADIQMPDMETRMAILKYKAERRGIQLPQDVVTYLARISKRSIRELEGNLNKVKMFSELQGLGITLDLAKRVLTSHDDTASITTSEIQKLVAEHYKVSVSDLKARSRTKVIVTARQAAMYLVKKHLDKSLVDIGRAFGGKDHTTVINALRKIENQQSKNLDLKRDIDEIEMKIHNITGV